MILSVPLQAGTSLSNVRYRWLTASGPGSEQSSGVTQQITDFAEFTIDVGTPPADAQELIVYDSTDHGNWNPAQYLLQKLAQVSDIPTANEIADAVLERNISGGSSIGRQVKEALAFLRNKWTLSGSTLTVYDTDDTTILWTSDIATTASAQPVTGSDPT